MTGDTHTREIPITNKQYLDWLNGRPIQYSMSHLNSNDSSFIRTGITSKEWASFWGEDQ